jgi:anti-sigma B factor antagonist
MNNSTINRSETVFRFDVEHDAERVTAHLSGEIDIANVRHLREALIALDDESVGQILLDLAEVTFIGSCGLAVLVATSKRCRAHGRELILSAPSRAVVVALAYSGLLHTFHYDVDSLAGAAQWPTRLPAAAAPNRPVRPRSRRSVRPVGFGPR